MLDKGLEVFEEVGEGGEEGEFGEGEGNTRIALGGHIVLHFTSEEITKGWGEEGERVNIFHLFFHW